MATDQPDDPTGSQPQKGARPVRIEVLVEPVTENAPGAHVTAAVDVLDRAGLEPEMGPFATTAEGDLTTVIETISRLLTDSFGAGAQTVTLRVTTEDR